MRESDQHPPTIGERPVVPDSTILGTFDCECGWSMSYEAIWLGGNSSICPVCGKNAVWSKTL